MWDGFARLRWVALGLGVLTMGSVVEASNISFKAVKKNGVVLTPGVCNLTTHLCTTGPVGKGCANNNDCPVGTNNLSVLANDTVEVEMYLSNWINDFPVDAVPNKVRAYQVTINRAGYVSNDNGSAKPLGWCGPVDEISCTDSATCPPEYATCLPDPLPGCTCLPHTPENGGFITLSRTDFLLFGVDGPTPEAITTNIDFVYYGIAENTVQAVTDTGVARYLGTLIVKVSANACGTFTIGFFENIAYTFITDPGTFKPVQSLPTLTPLTLTVSDCSRQLLSCNPGHCNLDARIGHNRLDASTRLTPFQVVMTFSKSTTSPNMTAADFEVTVLPDGAPPNINSLTPNPGDSKITTVSFLPRIQQTRWTCIREKGSNKRCCMGSLPPDADNSRISQLDDVFEVFDNLQGIVSPALTIEKCDIDRSVRCSPADLLMAVDVLTGADAFTPTMGDSLPALVPACPSMNMRP